MEGRGCGGYYGRGSGGPGGGRGSGRNGDRNGGRGRNGGGGYQQHCQTQYNESGGRGRGPGGGRGRGRNSGRGRNGGGGYQQHYQTQYNESGGRGRGRGYDNRAPQQQSSGRSAAGSGVWTSKQWGSSSASSSTGQTQNQVWRQPQNQAQRPHQSPQTSADSTGLNFQTLKITEQQQSLSSPENKILPMRRPDRGTLAVRSVRLLANHFPVTFNSRSLIMHYDIDIKQVSPAGRQSFNRTIPKHLLRSIKDKLFSQNPNNFPVDMVAYDGEKNIFSAVELPAGEFKVELSEGEDAIATSYIFTIKEVSRLELYRLKEYLGGRLSYIPRDILQGMDLVMKENPSKYRISVGRSFYCKNYRERDDLKCGAAAYRGFHPSLKPTSQGLALCLDYSVLAFRKPMPVLDFLKENIENFRVVDDVLNLREEVMRALKGLKVTVTHRITKQKYTISGLTEDSTRDLTFPLLDPDSQASPRKIRIVDYFWQKYGKKIKYLSIPCLDVGKPGKTNHIPMEFCVLVGGQVYPKEQLDKETAGFLKKISLVDPAERKSIICGMVQADDGPCGIVAKNFDIEVEKNMTSVQGRVLSAPELKLRATNGNIYTVRVDQEKCHWNLVGKSVVEGQHVDRWAVIDFTSTSRGRYKAYTQEFINHLRQRAFKLGMCMENPLACYSTGMHEISSVARIEKLLRKVIAAAGQNGGLQGKQLQVIVCIMTEKDRGYNYLKWVSETQIGVLTQCCLSANVNSMKDQTLANLCLKINAKVGGSNVELNERLPHFVSEDNVMFIGADVNHPAARNSTCPSIAAVVGTINWPATNRYAARIQPQEHRKEKIVNFGSICRDLVNTFAQHNNYRPKKIVVFRDGVSEGQFDMVLNEELVDLIRAISDEHYRPTITLVVAQKRHQTRLFLDRRDGGSVGNVPPGTVVDTTIIHPFEFDFYLCSHYGSIGTSKPTHYYVLWDENKFTSDELQKLIYNLCFTHARCTKPVSLVPPVFYADLVAYRGRLFQEVVMEQVSVPSRSTGMSSASSSSSSSSAASFHQDFYSLHPDLRNMMHFI